MAKLETNIKTKTLAISEIDVAKGPIIYTCFGLGSCVGVFISDKLNCISGGAHIPLPICSQMGEFLGATRLITKLMDLFSFMGSDLKHLQAKVVGGAKVFESSLNIGEQTAEAVLNELCRLQVILAATDLGGTMSRTARFNSQTGALNITSQTKNYII